MIDKEGEPWWIAADVCAVLGIANSRDAVGRLDDDEKGVASTDTPSGRQDVNIINESGLYSLILRSRREEAKRFKRWVTHEVLPSLRKTGIYIVHGGESPETAGALSIIRGFDELRADIAELKADMAQARKDARELPEPMGVLPEITDAQRIKLAAKTYAMMTGIKSSALWPMVYIQVEVRLKKRLPVLARKAGWKKSVIDYAIHEGYGDVIYAIIKNMIDKALPDADEGIHRAA